MKLLHTSDWHLGMVFKGNISYEQDQRYVINDICEIAKSENVDAILISGDVFDKSISTNAALSLYDEIITHICAELKIRVFIIAGNHDGAQRLAQCNRLLEKSGLYISGTLRQEPCVARFDDVDIYMLPWISTDKVKSVFLDSEKMIDSMESAYQTVLDKYRESFMPDKKNILLAHAFLVNSETSVSDKAAEIGQATMIGSHVFHGFDYVALGHLHGPQQINEHIRYSGSPMAYSFGKEEKQEKSVTIIDTDDMSKKIIPLNQLHKRTTLKGTFEELLNADFPEEIKKGYVKLEVSDSYVGLDSRALLMERYENLLEINSPGFDREDAKITMTIDEFQQMEDTPEIIFERYCEDILESRPDSRLRELFEKALKEYEDEVINQ